MWFVHADANASGILLPNKYIVGMRRLMDMH